MAPLGVSTAATPGTAAGPGAGTGAGIGLFAGLKWRMVTSRLRTLTGSKKAGMIVGLLLLLSVLVLAAIGLGLLRNVPEAGYLAITGLFAFQLIAWVLSPLVAFGVDETVDPQRFALLPIRPQQLQRGLLMASLVGYLPVANMIVLIGAVVGLSVLGWMFPVALVCAAVQLITCVVFSRAAATSMASMMSSRRGRDLGMLVGFGVLVLYTLGTFALNTEDGSGIGSGAAAVAEALSWTPPGALASLPAFLAAGMWDRVVIAVVTAAVFLAVGWWWWSRALVTSLTTVGSQTDSSAPSRGLGGGDAVGGSVLGTARVVAGRDMTLMWRDPMRRMPWMLALFMAIAWPLLVFQAGGAVFGAALGAILLGAQAANQLGIEGSGLWLHLVAFADRARARGEVLGHSLVVALPSAVLSAVAVVVLAIITDDWDNLPAALGLSWSALFGAVAAGTLLSVLVPYAVPQSRKSMFASSVPGQKGLTFRATIGTMLGGVLVALPAGACVWLSLAADSWWGWVGLVYGLLIAPLTIPLSVNLTARRYAERGPEILAVVSVGDRS